MVRTACIVGTVLIVIGGLLAVAPGSAAAIELEECTITGSEGPDVIDGTNGDDVICGLGGNDVINAGNGNDVVYGGEGNDSLFGGNGDDVLDGGAGADQIDAGNGVDSLVGGSSDDVLMGGNGNDALAGMAGNDVLDGGKGDDDLTGGPGFDAADGDNGHDSCAAEQTEACEIVLDDELGATPESFELTSPTDASGVFGIEPVVVTVVPADAEGSIRVLLDATLVGEAAIANGIATIDWDTSNHLDGEHGLTVDLLDDSGSTVDSQTVSVFVANETATEVRLELDHDQGRISTEEYVRLGLYSVTLPELVPDRYATDADLTETDVSPQILGYFLEFHNLSGAEQAAIRDYMEAYITGDPALADMVGIPAPDLEAAGNEPQAGPLLVAAPWLSEMMGAIQPSQIVYDDGGVGLGNWRGCTDSERWLPDTATVVVVGHQCHVAIDNFDFEYFIDIPGVDELIPGVPDGGVDGVPGSDQDDLALDGDLVVAQPCVPASTECNGIPDDVDEWAAALINSRDAYNTDIGMSDLSSQANPIRVVAKNPILGLPSHVFAEPFSETTIVLDTSPLASEFTAKHELFHVMQYASLDAGVLATGTTSWPRGTQETIRTWMEGSAEWAADFAESNDWSDPSSTNQLDEFLYKTDDFIFDFVDRPASSSDPEFQEQYGSFLFSEFIEKTHGASTIGDIWTAFEGQGVLPAGDVITSLIPDYPDYHADFWSNVYILEETQIDSFLGFTYGDELRSEFGGRPGTEDIGGQPLGGPIQVGESLGFAYDEGILPGGAVVWEIELPPGAAGTLQIEVDEQQDEVEYRLVAVDDYPHACAGASSDYLVLDAGVIEWTTNGSCDLAAIVATYTDITGDGLDGPAFLDIFRPAGPRRFPAFTVSLLPAAGIATNLDFETGDLSGWTILSSGDQGTVYEVVSPGLAGTDHAFHLSSTGLPVDGIQQSIEWQYAYCTVRAFTTGGAGTTVGLRVLDASDDSIWGSHEYTFTGGETEPVVLSVEGPTFYLPDVFTIELLFLGSQGTADVAFDEVNIEDCT